MKDNAIIGENIKYFRKNLGFSQENIANYLEVDTSLVSRLESGERKISGIQLTKLANLFGVDLASFFEENKEVNQINLAFAFRAESLDKNSLDAMSQFKKVILSYLNMQELLK